MRRCLQEVQTNEQDLCIRYPCDTRYMAFSLDLRLRDESLWAGLVFPKEVTLLPACVILGYGGHWLGLATGMGITRRV